MESQLEIKHIWALGSTFNGSFPNDWWEYNMDNDTWNQLSNFHRHGNHRTTTVGDKIYMGCGSNTSNLSDWWEYDITQDSWSQKTSLPTNDRHHPFILELVITRMLDLVMVQLRDLQANTSTGVSIYNDFYRYDPSNDSWLRLNDFPSEARWLALSFHTTIKDMF